MKRAARVKTKHGDIAVTQNRNDDSGISQYSMYKSVGMSNVNLTMDECIDDKLFTNGVLASRVVDNLVDDANLLHLTAAVFDTPVEGIRQEERHFRAIVNERKEFDDFFNNPDNVERFKENLKKREEEGDDAGDLPPWH